MKKFLAIIAAAFTLAAPTAMQANQGFYVGGLGGVNFLQHDKHDKKTDAGYILGLVAGHAWCNGFRAEGEISYRGNQTKEKNHHHTETTDLAVDDSHKHHKDNLHRWSFMANGYYDIDMCWCVTPYVGAGIGFDTINGRKKHNHDDSDDSDRHHHKKKKDETSFAWQVMAGASYEMCCDWDLNVEYKFHGSRENEYNHAITVGVSKYLSCCF